MIMGSCTKNYKITSNCTYQLFVSHVLGANSFDETSFEKMSQTYIAANNKFKKFVAQHLLQQFLRAH